MILGIDASTPGSGGGRRHLIEIIKRFNPEEHAFSKIKIWGVSSLLKELPDEIYIEKITHPYLNKGFFYRLFWQIFLREKMFTDQVDILFSPFGTYSSKKIPFLSMSRNMLLFDRNERMRFGLTFLRLKFKLLQFKQIKSFKNANGIIFLSEYAKKMIAKKVPIRKINTKIIHHGISEDFIKEPKQQHKISNYSDENPYKLLYVSSVWVYKHPWNVVKAVKRLRDIGYPVTLTIVGSNDQPKSGKILKNTIAKYDPKEDFVFWQKGISLNEISEIYKGSDAFIFASTCENMPNILVEAMSSGLPILCSSYQPMPEFLGDGGIYFDPTKSQDLTDKLKYFIDNPEIRLKLASTSWLYSKKYNWNKCAKETFSFLYDVIKDKKNV